MKNQNQQQDTASALHRKVDGLINQQQQDKATPRPWQCDDGGKRIYGPDYSIAKTYGYNAAADAALIVKAVNEHEALEAVAEAASRIKAMLNNEQHEYRPAIEMLESVLAALAAIRAQQ